ncbi:tRNA lysidine(34) synthetase TilS [Shewanella canadensis]|uniref:tRNA(Ile)-lysidine synthase n=1 Tax=Shewanella canadensis TaxID=271096 RepID=A0A3S0RYE9_9GAMM|nr:tRNA lysidine(34) synthetase TilS [Shewanella canadensis]RTR39268.1 tRNA lysidine(34) synthetase TilS [Shewanella canadensis]
MSNRAPAPEFDASSLIADCVAKASVDSGSQLVLAYSGGVDSEVLAQGLARFARHNPQYRYLLVHVHHGLSLNADAWVSHCQSQAVKYHLPIEIKQVKVKMGPRLSIEAQARSARYEAITSLMAPGDALLTAHHLDDQLETVLLALKRGLGPKGLSAMGEVQAFDKNKQLLRPLLSISREQIEALAASQAISHIEDESNQDSKFDRNFLRLEIIPKLKARWSSIAVTASRSAALCAQQQAVIDEEVSKRLPSYIVPVSQGRGTALELSGLSEQGANWQLLLLRGYIEYLGFAPLSQVQLEQVLYQLLDARVDAKVELRLGDTLVRRFRGRAYLSSVEAEHAERIKASVFEWDLTSLLSPDCAEIGDGVKTRNREAELYLSVSEIKSLQARKLTQFERVRLPQIDELVSVRFAIAGSTRCSPHNRQKGRELKKLWQESGIPPWEREKVPFIFYNNVLVCAVGYWIEKAFLCRDASAGLSFKIVTRN